MISTNQYYVQAFTFLRDQGFIYSGSGVYERDGVRINVRSYDEWSASPKAGYYRLADGRSSNSIPEYKSATPEIKQDSEEVIEEIL